MLISATPSGLYRAFTDIVVTVATKTFDVCVVDIVFHYPGVVYCVQHCCLLSREA